MQNLARRYGCEVGLSDHCLRPYAAYTAVALGAAVIEKHFTLNRSLGGVDASFSLEPHEFQELARGLELVWCSRGKVVYGAKEAELSSLKERPSIYVVRAVGRGECFTRDNIRVIRPGNGLPPRMYEAVLGKVSSQDIAGGTPMSWEFIRMSQEEQSVARGDADRSRISMNVERMRRVA
jgi:N-acetylneuraminate synthase